MGFISDDTDGDDKKVVKVKTICAEGSKLRSLGRWKFSCTLHLLSPFGFQIDFEGKSAH